MSLLSKGFGDYSKNGKSKKIFKNEKIYENLILKEDIVGIGVKGSVVSLERVVETNVSTILNLLEKSRVSDDYISSVRGMVEMFGMETFLIDNILTAMNSAGGFREVICDDVGTSVIQSYDIVLTAFRYMEYFKLTTRILGTNSMDVEVQLPVMYELPTSGFFEKRVEHKADSLCNEESLVTSEIGGFSVENEAVVYDRSVDDRGVDRLLSSISDFGCSSDDGSSDGISDGFCSNYSDDDLDQRLGGVDFYCGDSNIMSCYDTSENSSDSGGSGCDSSDSDEGYSGSCMCVKGDIDDTLRRVFNEMVELWNDDTWDISSYNIWEGDIDGNDFIRLSNHMVYSRYRHMAWFVYRTVEFDICPGFNCDTRRRGRAFTAILIDVTQVVVCFDRSDAYMEYVYPCDLEDRIKRKGFECIPLVLGFRHLDQLGPDILTKAKHINFVVDNAELGVGLYLSVFRTVFVMTANVDSVIKYSYLDVTNQSIARMVLIDLGIVTDAPSMYISHSDFSIGDHVSVMKSIYSEGYDGRLDVFYCWNMRRGRVLFNSVKRFDLLKKMEIPQDVVLLVLTRRELQMLKDRFETTQDDDNRIIPPACVIGDSVYKELLDGRKFKFKNVMIVSFMSVKKPDKALVRLTDVIHSGHFKNFSIMVQTIVDPVLQYIRLSMDEELVESITNMVLEIDYGDFIK